MTNRCFIPGREAELIHGRTREERHVDDDEAANKRQFTQDFVPDQQGDVEEEAAERCKSYEPRNEDLKDNQLKIDPHRLSRNPAQLSVWGISYNPSISSAAKRIVYDAR